MRTMKILALRALGLVMTSIEPQIVAQPAGKVADTIFFLARVGHKAAHRIGGYGSRIR